MCLFQVLGSVIAGFFVGLVARALVPGAHPMGFWATVILGIAGSLVGGWIGQLASKPKEGERVHPAGCALSILGAIVALVVLRMIRG